MTKELDKAVKKAKRQYQKKWRENNKEHLRKYYQEYRKNNPEKYKEYQRRYWEKKAKELMKKEA